MNNGNYYKKYVIYLHSLSIFFPSVFLSKLYPMADEREMNAKLIFCNLGEFSRLVALSQRRFPCAVRFLPLLNHGGI